MDSIHTQGKTTPQCPKCHGAVGPDAQYAAPEARCQCKVAKPKKQSRADRWAAAASEASDAISRLVELQSEYQEWRDGLPENLENSPTAEKLDAVCDLDLQGASDTLDEAAECELPLGFGRD
jgi:hypothetical protein